MATNIFGLDHANMAFMFFHLSLLRTLEREELYLPFGKGGFYVIKFYGMKFYVLSLVLAQDSGERGAIPAVWIWKGGILDFML